VLTAKGRATVAYFEAVARAIHDGKTAVNRMSDLIFPALTERKEEIEQFPLKAPAFAEFIQELATANSQDRREVLKVMLEKGLDVRRAKEVVGIKTLDEAALREAARVAIAANPKAVADFKKGKDQAKMSIVGAVMKTNKGAPNEVVRRLVDEELAKI
jgi:aspartyl-tRNA(Asn)/glutamyl-tRNA(Gln) amidotransferase subunit B